VMLQIGSMTVCSPSGDAHSDRSTGQRHCRSLSFLSSHERALRLKEEIGARVLEVQPGLRFCSPKVCTRPLDLDERRTLVWTSLGPGGH
jgi:hypothetical protein